LSGVAGASLAVEAWNISALLARKKNLRLTFCGYVREVSVGFFMQIPQKKR
jgi:hypothetical protein